MAAGTPRPRVPVLAAAWEARLLCVFGGAGCAPRQLRGRMFALRSGDRTVLRGDRRVKSAQPSKHQPTAPQTPRTSSSPKQPARPVPTRPERPASAASFSTAFFASRRLAPVASR